MIVVIDTNILFSACLTPSSKISEILFNPLANIERVSCYYAIAELFKHQEKIIELSKQPAEKLSTVLYAIMRQIEFFNEKIIQPHHLQEAGRLTADVDKDDVNFVALALQKNGWLWTGDKKLMNHLKKLGFERVVTTGELYEMVF